MKRSPILTTVMIILFMTGVQAETLDQFQIEYPLSFSVTIQNPTNQVRTDEMINLSVSQIRMKYPDFNLSYFVILLDNQEIPGQFIKNRNGEDQIIFKISLKPSEQTQVAIRYSKNGMKERQYPKQTQAELSHKVGGKFVNRIYEGGTFQNVSFLQVPPEHTDHSFYIRYEGPGWESDLVGYRFYLDWRNAIDVYGKKTHEMVLQNVGLDGFDSYHEMSDWGMDILKVGESLGLGTIGIWLKNKAERVSSIDSSTCEIIENGSSRSQIQTKYFGWKTEAGKFDLISDLTIDAGSRLTKHTLQMTDNPPNLCTGIVKMENTTVFTSPVKDNGWMYLATYGKQSLAGDSLGLAIIFRKNDLIKLTEDPNSHVVVLKPTNNSLTYHFLAAWEKEPNGIRSCNQFVQYLNETVRRLDNPILIKIE